MAGGSRNFSHSRYKNPKNGGLGDNQDCPLPFFPEGRANSRIWRERTKAENGGTSMENPMKKDPSLQTAGRGAPFCWREDSFHAAFFPADFLVMQHVFGFFHHHWTTPKHDSEPRKDGGHKGYDQDGPQKKIAHGKNPGVAVSRYRPISPAVFVAKDHPAENGHQQPCSGKNQNPHLIGLDPGNHGNPPVSKKEGLKHARKGDRFQHNPCSWHTKKHAHSRAVLRKREK